jgi:chemotaxis protein methyltransferase CheR
METSSRPERLLPPPGVVSVPEMDDAAYERLAREVRMLLGIDLSQYRRAQVWRRVNGFALAKGLPGPDALVARVRRDAVLRQTFLDMLTINVSEFFRNPEAWDVLAERHLGPILRRQQSVRIWSAGCSLGYEPFTLAMLALELAPDANLQILATDVDETVLSRARVATYNEAQMAGVSAVRRSRFFLSKGDKWEIRPEVRALVEFRRHDLLRDPYEQSFDIIVCRNVVIYFTEGAKLAMYRRFGGALRSGGILFLGATESILNVNAVGLESVGSTFYRRP